MKMWPVLILLYPFTAQARSGDLRLEVGGVVDAKYPQISFDLAVSVPLDKSAARADQAGYQIAIAEDGTDAGAVTISKPKQDPKDSTRATLKVTYKSTIAEKRPRELTLKVEVAGVSNRAGDKLWLIGDLKPNAFAVVVAKHKSYQKAWLLGSKYIAAGLPRHPEYMGETRWLVGLPPKLNVYISVIASREDVARAIAAQASNLGIKAEVVPLSVPRPTPLRVLVLSSTIPVKTAHDWSTPGAVKVTWHPTGTTGESRPAADSSVVLPFLWPDQAPLKGTLVSASDGFTCALPIPAPKPDQWVVPLSVALSPDVCKKTP